MKKLLLSAAVVLVPAGWASAGPVYNFYKLPNTYVGQENIGSQLSVEVRSSAEDPTRIGANQVGFLFKNNVGVVSSITEVYFDDGSLFGISAVHNSAGVFLVQDSIGTTNPANLPGGPAMPVPFNTTQYYSADSGNGGPSRGINAAIENSLIVFNLKLGRTYQNVLDALVLGGTDGSDPEALRIGLHVISIGTGGQSAGYVNVVPVPLPAAAWMGMGLLGCVGGVGYIRKRRYVAE